MISLKKIFAVIISFILIVSFPANLVCATSSDAVPASGAPQVSCEAAIVIDAKTGQILYEKNAYGKMYPASITKIMTALLAMEKGTLSDTVTMSEDAVWGIDRNSSHIALDVGEQITLEQALYAVLIASANEAAWAVAEHISGTLSDFCTLMNSRAKELGCVNTNFVNANGLHDDNHYTCAYDMALITREALKHDDFRTITSTSHYIIPPTNKNTDQRDLWSKNYLILPDSQYYYPYCEGGKTGFTDEAGGTLVSWSKKDDKELICVLMNAVPTSLNFTDTAALYNYFFDNYSYQTPLDNYVFTGEQLTLAENYLNDFYGGVNAGTLTLSIDAPGEFLVNTSSESPPSATLSLSDEQISEHIIGTLVYGNETETYLTLPVHYSGYISSTDETAIKETIADGIFKKNSEKKSPVPIIIILALLLAGAGAFYLRIKYVQKQRAAYRKRRDVARKNNKPF